MDSSIEAQRALHEEIERVQQAIVRALLQIPKTHKEKIAQEHRISDYLTRIQARSKLLRDLYIDEDGSRKKEIESMAPPNEFSAFYQRLKNVKDYHRRNPAAQAETIEQELANVDPEKEMEELENLFTGEEQFGRFLDLNALYTQYVNLKGVEKINYTAYLDVMDQFDSIPAGSKNADYDRYLEELMSYLKGFLSRAQPLLNVNALNEETRVAFEEDWEETQPASDPLFCEACSKLFAKETVFDAHLTGKKHLKAAEALKATGDSINKDRLEKAKTRAWHEYLIRKYLELLHEIREDTKSAVERKQTLTLEEYDARAEEEQEQVVEETESEPEDDEDKIPNPLNLPLGWDGKPIPLWLFKQYGLGIKYPCEICGNYIYMGRQAFEQHFSEWRHSQGLRCLGIPNSKQFKEITLIEDAIELWKKIQRQEAEKSTKAEMVEEFEDAQGNIFNKKTYEDLRRQGFL